MAQERDVVRHETVLVISVTCISGADICVSQEVPNLVPELKVRKSLFQCFLSLVAFGIPLLDIWLGADWQGHEALQLPGKIVARFSCASVVVKGRLHLFSEHIFAGLWPLQQRPIQSATLD
jgi:hypothetical protein